ncbi:MAG TPA: efflux transporter periplasmic adaptor subunit, partial [Planctomycetaceae bacterium]|nr:efflux transporter periplasmic adaptor subunit [Planctomycetaceae bacterium]
MSLALLIAGCNENASQPPAAPPTEVFVATPLVLSIVEWDEYTGRLDALDSVEVRARVSGYLESTHFSEGQLVERGDLLAVVDPRPFEAALNAASARLEESRARLAESEALLRQAEAEKADSDAQLTLSNSRLARANQLLSSNAISRDEVDLRISEQLQATAATEAANAKIESAKAGIATSSASIETAKANREAAAIDLQFTQIRAPIDGRISQRFVTQGNLISGGSNQSTLLTTILSTNPIHCYFDANEQAFLKYVRLSRSGARGSSREVKNPVLVALVDEDGYPHTGHMDFVDNRIDPNTGTMRGRAILDNSDGLLTPGLFVSLRLPGSGKYDAILIPDSAIGSDQSEKFVYVVSEKSSSGGDESRKLVERRAIILGPLSHGLRIVRSGIEGDELIVTRGLQRIYPGVEIVPREEEISAEGGVSLPD